MPKSLSYPERLIVHLLGQTAHGSQQSRQLPSLSDRSTAVKAMLQGIGVTDRGAERGSPMHPAAAIRHRGRSAGFVPHGRQSGTLQWTRTNSQQPVCRAEYDVTLGEDSGILHLANTTSLDPFGRAVRLEGQVIQLVSTPLPYGGCRWWFLCPHSGRRVLKLHLPCGAKGFASRQAYRLGYAVQRQSARDQAYRRARKARDRIGGSSNLCERLPFKPKWMRWATYWRHVDACERAERQTLGFLATSAQTILGRPIS